MSAPVPTLSAAGWLTEITDKADRLFAYYLSTDYSQTMLYEQKVISLAYHIATYGGRPLELEQIVKMDLTRYFDCYFEGTDVNVRTNSPDLEDPERINLTLDIIVVEKGFRYSLGKEIRVASNKTYQVFEKI